MKKNAEPEKSGNKFSNEYVHSSEAAELLGGISRQRLSVLLKKGLLKGIKNGRDWFVEKQSLEERINAFKDAVENFKQNSNDDTLKQKVIDKFHPQDKCHLKIVKESLDFFRDKDMFIVKEEKIRIAIRKKQKKVK